MGYTLVHTLKRHFRFLKYVHFRAQGRKACDLGSQVGSERNLLKFNHGLSLDENTGTGVFTEKQIFHS